jgi:hypothetical protein
MFIVTFGIELDFEAFTVRSCELGFGSCNDADGDEEAEETNKWVDESNYLPHVIVTSITS